MRKTDTTLYKLKDLQFSLYFFNWLFSIWIILILDKLNYQTSRHKPHLHSYQGENQHLDSVHINKMNTY